MIQKGDTLFYYNGIKIQELRFVRPEISHHLIRIRCTHIEGYDVLITIGDSNNEETIEAFMINLMSNFDGLKVISNYAKTAISSNIDLIIDFSKENEIRESLELVDIINVLRREDADLPMFEKFYMKRDVLTCWQIVLDQKEFLELLGIKFNTRELEEKANNIALYHDYKGNIIDTHFVVNGRKMKLIQDEKPLPPIQVKYKTSEDE
jgi:hypothetical protein